MMPPGAQSGWDTGYFRLADRSAGDNGLTQLFFNVETREVKGMPYDAREDNWFPLFIYMGRTKEEQDAAQRQG